MIDDYYEDPSPGTISSMEWKINNVSRGRLFVPPTIEETDEDDSEKTRSVGTPRYPPLGGSHSRTTYVSVQKVLDDLAATTEGRRTRKSISTSSTFARGKLRETSYKIVESYGDIRLPWFSTYTQEAHSAVLARWQRRDVLEITVMAQQRRLDRYGQEAFDEDKYLCKAFMTSQKQQISDVVASFHGNSAEVVLEGEVFLNAAPGESCYSRFVTSWTFSIGRREGASMEYEGSTAETFLSKGAKNDFHLQCLL
ncbi:hypothetical protein HZH66_014360 [Vespula vulgaris]|uniref:Uncharacterized protein n=1 Tax=Vespula vulgaris TaxID=7454 RepID=A0A834J1M6_VESVU|nr:hypothetical protein HZH66_014360 [Vespula vulgaris]